jgi:asparagine synthase (glutamine-hydrolysing)
MCGIAGYSSLSETPDLRRVSHLLHHRGPDDLGFFEDKVNGIGMVHTRLSILDTSIKGHQPMKIEDDQVVIVFNGEIYNYLELRAQLEKEGEVFHGESDTEVLLRYYLRHGRDSKNIGTFLNRLNGIFAFALWDGNLGEMLIARDAFGVKPLYISESSNYLAFSSEIKALTPLIDQPLELDFVSLDGYLTNLWCPGEGTPVSNIKKLGPGEALWVRNGKIRDRLRWYKLPALRNLIEGKSLSEKEMVSGTASHLRDAVHRQMVSDVPVGAFLSGGLDSSAVVSFAGS